MLPVQAALNATILLFLKKATHHQTRKSSPPCLSSLILIQSSHESNQVDLLFAKAVYCSAAPLSMFANPHWQQFFHRLRPAWNPPSTFKLSNSLLDEWKG